MRRLAFRRVDLEASADHHRRREERQADCQARPTAAEQVAQVAPRSDRALAKERVDGVIAKNPRLVFRAGAAIQIDDERKASMDG